MTHEQIQAKIQTPMSKSDPNDVKIESIPLPPPEMWSTLDNSTAIAPATMSAEAAVAPVTPVVFFGKQRSTTVPLQFPFTLDGSTITGVTIRRLTLGEVQDLLAKTRGRTLVFMEIYAEMTGLSVDTLKGLDDEDGVAITDAAYDFLPPRFKTDDASSAT